MITRSGDYIENLAAGTARYGERPNDTAGVGSLTVDAGSAYVLSPTSPTASSPDASLVFGRLSGSSGTGSIAGAGSEIQLTSSGSTATNAGATVTVGRVGTGQLTLTSGATLSLSDTVGTGVSATGDGYEQLQVGRGGNGTLTVDASAVQINGTGALFRVGREGGTGSATFSNGSTLTMSSTIAAAEAGISVGFSNSSTAGSQGTLTLNNSTANLTGPGETYVLVGRSGTGTMSLLNGSSVTLQSANFSNLFVGRGTIPNSTGTMTIDASTFSATSTAAFSGLTVGTETTGNGTLTLTNGGQASFHGVGAGLQIGRSGGTGVMNVGTGTTVSSQNVSSSQSTSSFMDVGKSGGTGIVDVNGGTIALTSQSYASVAVGGNSFDGVGTGSLTVRNGGVIEFSKTLTSALLIGSLSGADGQVQVQSGGHINLDKTGTGGGFLAVGDHAGVTRATLTISGTNSLVDGVQFATVGRNEFDANSNGGSGTLIVENGGKLTINSGLNVGEGGLVSGHNGTLVGNLGLRGGQVGDAGGLIETLNIVGNLFVDRGTVRLDANSSATDKINVTGSVSFVNGTVAVAVAGGYQFAQGESRDLFTTGGFGFNPGNVDTIVQGQASSFGFVLAQLAGTNRVVLEALNSGGTGGNALLDFGASSATAVNLTYDALAKRGTFTGGRFLSGEVENATEIRATNGNDFINAGAGSSGTAQNLTLYGRNGNDAITAGFGNDTVNGGADSDNLDGGAGSDVAVYAGTVASYSWTRTATNSFTITDSVAGRDGADTLTNIEVLRFSDGSATLSMTASGWITNVYDAQNRQNYTRVVNDDGTLAYIDYDQASTDPWQRLEQTFDNQSRLDTSKTIFDNNTTFYTDYDQSANNNWLRLEQTFDDQNRFDTSKTIFDDGTTFYTDYDQIFANTWLRLEQTFDNQSRLDTSKTIFDDGSTFYTDYDQSGEANWTRLEQTFDTQSRLDTSKTIFDDNTVFYTDYDQGAAFNWVRLEQTFDAQARLDTSKTLFDDGKTFYTDYDQAFVQNWTRVEQQFDAQSRLDWTKTIYDNGTITYTDQDQDSSQAWTFVAQDFNASGQLVRTTTFYDDGHTVVG